MKRFFALFATVLFGVQSAHAEYQWSVAQRTYEGYPLFLRYPVGLDYDKLKKSLPILLTITIPYSEVTDNGLPVARYNREVLEPLDAYIFEYIKQHSVGRCVLVETFHGTRHYYIYASRAFDPAKLKIDISSKYLDHPIEYYVSNDPNWSFIRKYAKEYLGGS